jgi:hypothetical protein
MPGGEDGATSGSLVGPRRARSGSHGGISPPRAWPRARGPPTSRVCARAAAASPPRSPRRVVHKLVHPPRPRRLDSANRGVPGRHCLPPPLPRVPDVQEHVEDGSDFALHTPRPPGNTAFLMPRARALSKAGQHAALDTRREFGRGFAPAALDRVDELSGGHPWRVSARANAWCMSSRCGARSRGPTSTRPGSG